MKFVSDNLKHYWQRGKDFCVYKVLHADDPPHRLALGIAIGMFVTFLPLMGVQMMLSFFLAWLLRANKVVGVPLVWISNPLTIIPIYYPCYVLGCKLLGLPDEWARLKVNWQTAEPGVTLGNKIGLWWENLWNSLLEIVGPLGLGCLIVASVAGILSYYLSLVLIRRYRLRRWGQLMPPRLTPVDNQLEDEVSSSKKSETGKSETAA